MIDFGIEWDDPTWKKKTGYKVSDTIGYKGNKFDRKCFQRQLRESQPLSRPVMTDEELRNSYVREISFKKAQDFILKFEWLGTMGTTKFSYGLFTPDGDMFAVYCFGLTAGTQVLSQPFGDEYKNRGIVLVRGACANFAHPHASSYGIGKVMPLVRERGYDFVIAYSDLEAGEIGTVYQATNWEFFGMTNPVTYLVRPDGKRVDPKLIHKYAKKNNITRQEQIEIFENEGYTFEKGSPKLKYILVIGDKKTKKKLNKVKRYTTYPYLKRRHNMEEVLEEAKQLIKGGK